MEPKSTAISPLLPSYEYFKHFDLRLEQEGIDYAHSYNEWKEEFIKKYTDIQTGVKGAFIPYVTHMIYIFSESSEKATLPLYIEERIIRSAKGLNENDNNWKHNFSGPTIRPACLKQSKPYKT